MSMTDTDKIKGSVTEIKYPPAPWRLTGQLYGSVWAVPAAQFKAKLPPAFKPVVNLGRIGIFAGFVDYQAGSPLVYHELIAGVVVRLRNSWRFAFNVTDIWVDDEASKAGGRALWGVPKELAEFEFKYRRTNRDFAATARESGGNLLAEGDFRSVIGLPTALGLPTPFPNLQMLNGHPHATSAVYWSAVQICRGGMNIPVGSPLAALGIAGRKPLVSFAGLDFKMKLQAARPVK